MAHLTILKTTQAVIEKLGGVAAVAALTQRHYTATFNWLAQPTFPSNTYVVMTTALKAAGCTAPDSLWSMTPALAG